MSRQRLFRNYQHVAFSILSERYMEFVTSPKFDVYLEDLRAARGKPPLAFPQFQSYH